MRHTLPMSKRKTNFITDDEFEKHIAYLQKRWAARSLAPNGFRAAQPSRSEIMRYGIRKLVDEEMEAERKEKEKSK